MSRPIATGRRRTGSNREASIPMGFRCKLVRPYFIQEACREENRGSDPASGARLAIGGARHLPAATSAEGRGGRETEGQPVHVLKGGGGNTAVFVTDNGVVVVDTKNPGWGQPILDKIKELTPKPVTTIINTHTHGDHVSGNVEFPATVEVITQENTKMNMEQMKPVTGFTQQQPPTNIFKANNGKGLPKRTFEDKMSIGSGDDRIDLYYFGRGHTNGDAWVVFRALRVMHAGDIFSGKNLPLLDANNGGSGVKIGDTLAKAAKRQGRGLDHHRSQHPDDDERPRGVCRVQSRVPEDGS